MESMINGQHDTVDHDFNIGGEIFKKLYYLIDGIYPSLSQFLGPETDPVTRLDGTFKIKQEGSQKDVEQGFGVLKIKFLALTHPINLHHRDNIYYLVLLTILLYNMMVEERVSNDEMEDGSCYNRIDPNDCDGDNTEEKDDGGVTCEGVYGNSPLDTNEKFKMVHMRWEELCDYDGSKKLKDAIKRHLYRNMYGHDALEMAHMVMDCYNPLSYK